ncbi:DNA-binding transcriptional activator of the SARP family [Streptomyces zhaozhouensis]|uniref:DNA-binding transcriptional activator of the SARP family n=1 Tax=Streptomyces zhaozhouensis TaxID=1300267 RepID=A0A286DVI9_9ACTN|nr:AfsR/SARP family transcriptional regulator [Streptomyces zhaozhouensis]SOD62630.1 DNA-binding transcriptional activator of the SARP family [Streptomyces zhaozhouensis]
MSQTVRFATLGPVGASRGQQSISVGSPQQQAMLAVLLLRAGRAASLQELIDAVWGPTSPNSAPATIRTYAWRLRQALAESRTKPRTLISVGDGYRLALARRDVDALWAEQLASQAVEHRSAGRLAKAGEQIGQALALWRGEPLAGVPGPHAEQQRQRLGELRLTLLEEHFEVLLRQGAPALAVPELGALASAHPLRERFHALHMRALHSTGRLADALAAYHRLRERLVEELGVEPSLELRDLYQRLLLDDPATPQSEARGREQVALAPAESGAAFPVEEAAEPWRAIAPEPVASEAGERAAHAAEGDEAPAFTVGAPVPAQLPNGAVDFTGRVTALGTLTRALVTHRYDAPPVVLITGMGGVGKTALAVRAAHEVRQRFPDGQLYADMRGTQHDATAPGLVLSSFLTALGVAARAVPENVDDRAGLLRSLLNGKRVLIVLDNVRDTAQINQILPGTASCAVLMTSRARLWGLPTSARVDLTGFRTDEAVALVERVAGPASVNRDLSAVVELVHRCGLLPLAVRIAASRLASRPHWGAAALSARLADERRRLSELRAGDLAVEAVFEIGYQQLSAEQARAFRLIATVCDPEIGLPAASAVLGLDENETEAQLESLVDASLLETSQPGRYRCHGLLRAFGQQQTSAAERLCALDRLIDFLVATTAHAFRHVVPGDRISHAIGPSRSSGMRFDDACAAREWVATEARGAFTAVLEVAREARAALAAASEPVGADTVRKAVGLLIALTAFGPHVQRERLAQAASALAEAAEALDDKHTVGRAHFLCGNIAVQRTLLTEAREHLRIAEINCRATEDLLILCQVLNDLGLIALFAHDYEEAAEHLEEAAPLARRLGQRSGELVATLNAALARLRGGRAEEARAVCEEAVATLRASSDSQGLAYALVVLGLSLHELGRYEEAVGRYMECLRLSRTLGLREREAQAHHLLADTLRALGRPTEAADAAARGVARASDGCSERVRGHALVALGRALADLGQGGEAAVHLTEAEEIFTRLGLPEAGEARALRDAAD